MEWARAVLGADGVVLFDSDHAAGRPEPVIGVGLTSAASRMSGPDLVRLATWYSSEAEGPGAGGVAQGPPPVGRSFLLGAGALRARWAVVVPAGGGSQPTGRLLALWRHPRKLEDADLRSLRIVGRLLGSAFIAPPTAARRGQAEHAKQVRAFFRIARLSHATLTPQAVGGRLLAEFCRTLGFSRAEIWLFGPDRKRLWRFSGHGLGRLITPTVPGGTIRPCSFSQLVLRKQKGLHHADVGRGDLSPSELAVLPGVVSIFGAPLLNRGTPSGLLYADHGGCRFDMSATDLELGTALAALGGEVLNSALARQREARRQGRMLLLSRVNQAIAAEDSLPVLLRRVAGLIRQAAQCRGVIIVRIKGRGQDLEVAAASGPGARRLVGRGCSSRSADPFFRRCAGSILAGKTFFSTGPGVLPRSGTWWSDIRSCFAVPIRLRGKVIGGLWLETERPGAFDEVDRSVFSLIGEQLGHAVRRGRVLEDLRRRQVHLRAVSENLERMLEEDRRRIARELHDELAQSMTAAKINLALMRQLVASGGPEMRRTIRDTEALVERMIVETRRISMDLRPSMLDDLGLLPALKWLASTFARRTGIKASVTEAGPELRTDPGLKTLLYRFVQEALTNVARHARARSVRVALEQKGGTIRAVVQDDGTGIRPRSDHRRPRLGLIGMRERIERAGGSLAIESSRRSGTCLVAEIPAGPASRKSRRRRSSSSEPSAATTQVSWEWPGPVDGAAAKLETTR